MLMSYAYMQEEVPKPSRVYIGCERPKVNDEVVVY
jgi:hypothetical protein